MNNKIWALITATIAISLTYADTTNSQKEAPVSPQAEAMAAHPSARPGMTSGWDLFITADWLIWQANESGLGYAINNQDIDTTQTLSLGSGSVKSPHFEWEYGVRLGLGYNMPHDQWDLRLNWTWFRDHASSHTSSGFSTTEALYPVFMNPDATSTFDVAAAISADAHLHLQLNVLDLEMGRQFYAGKWLSLRPHFGLRNAWVDQTYKVSYDTLYNSTDEIVLDDYHTHMKNDYWGLGVRGGLDTQWGLGAGFSIFGNAAVSVLYGFFDIHHSEHYVESSTSSGYVLSEKNSFRAGRAVTDLQIGMRWDKNFANDRFHFGVQAGWEHHMFFSQNQIMRFVDSANPAVYVQNQ